MIPKSLLDKDLGTILSSAGAHEFYKNDFCFKGRFAKNAEVIFEDRALGVSNTLLMGAKDFYKADLKLKDILTEAQTLKKYQITQILTEANNALKRLLLQEINPSKARL